MRDKTIPDPFQSKNIREFFSFLCKFVEFQILVLSAHHSIPLSPFYDSAHRGISLQYSLILWCILIYVNFIIYMICWMLWNPIYLLIIVVRNDKCVGHGFETRTVQWIITNRSSRFLKLDWDWTGSNRDDVIINLIII